MTDFSNLGVLGRKNHLEMEVRNKEDSFPISGTLDLRDTEKTFHFEMPVGTEVGYC